MDPIDILGGLLGGKRKGGGGLGGSILKDILGGGSSRTSSPPSSGTRPQRDHRSIEAQAKSLEDLLGVSKGRFERRSADTRSDSRHDSRSTGAGYPTGNTGSAGGGFSFDTSPPVGRREPPDQNEEAIVLIRAMIQAAKSDGQVSQQEQQQILDRLSGPSPQALQFLRSEFERKIDVREFTWSVPLGMEEKVYIMSLGAIDLDSQAEVRYLRDLAHGLRLSPQVINQIHNQYRAPSIY